MTATGHALLPSEIAHGPHLRTRDPAGISETMTQHVSRFRTQHHQRALEATSGFGGSSFFDRFSSPPPRHPVTTLASLLDQLDEGGVVDVDDLARVCHTSADTVIGWRQQNTTPTKEAEERLLETQAVVDLVRRVLHDDAAASWIRAPNRNMGYEKPLDLIEAGNFHLVIDSLLAFAEGATT